LSTSSFAGRCVLAVVAGLLVAFSMPPWGFWPLSFVGVALLELVLGPAPTPRRRALYGGLFGASWTYLGMAWMVQLTVPGYLIAGIVYGGFHALAELAVPPGRWNVIGRPAAHTLVEALRFSFPFGGVPLASMGIAQVGGPFAGLARVGGVILITWVVFQLGFLAGALIRDRWPRRTGAGASDATPAAEATPTATQPFADRPVGGPLVIATALSVVIVMVLAAVAPRGNPAGETMRVAAVQGGGEQGTTALEVPSSLVTARHLEATASIAPDPELDLVLWPENTIDVVSFEESDLLGDIAAEAARLGVPIAVGVTEDTDDRERFLNAQVVVAPNGEIVGRYDKVRRVPFGEYVPLRGVLEAIGAPVDRIGRDAVAGTGPAYVELPDGVGLAVVISWEVFFGGRAREGVREGGLAILNPTNGASYTGTIVQTQQVASSRLRSIENGRWTVQAAPTGFTAVIDADGTVLERSAISERTILFADVELRDGFTWYTNLGDAPAILAVLAIYLLAVALELRDRRSRRGAAGATSRSSA
jgi:apolipoprotein N-acyltransferase